MLYNNDYYISTIKDDSTIKQKKKKYTNNETKCTIVIRINILDSLKFESRAFISDLRPASIKYYYSLRSYVRQILPASHFRSLFIFLTSRGVGL